MYKFQCCFIIILPRILPSRPSKVVTRFQVSGWRMTVGDPPLPISGRCHSSSLLDPAICSSYGSCSINLDMWLHCRIAWPVQLPPNCMRKRSHFCDGLYCRIIATATSISNIIKFQSKICHSLWKKGKKRKRKQHWDPMTNVAASSVQ